MKKIILLFAGLAFFTFKNQAQTVTDIDGNVYNTITIGTQVWLKENLKVTHYRNGDSIPNVTDSTAWMNLTTDAYCNFNNTTNSDTINTYGRLYNWYAVNDNRNIAPEGWHVASDSEWTTLTTYFGGISVAGGKLKDTTLWISPNAGATNESGFTALPGGGRYWMGFKDINLLGYWWSSTEHVTYNYDAWNRAMFYDNSNVNKTGYYKYAGFSVRCIKDSVVNQINDNSIDKQIQIYPNPTTDKVFINIIERQDLKMQIYNVVGECVLQGELYNGTNDIDVSSLSKGIYIIKLTGTDLTVQRKLTKE